MAIKPNNQKTIKQEPLGWQKLKSAAQQVKHGKLLVTIREGVPQVFSVVGQKEKLFP
jgi:hypothetical protein